jgi:membrane protease YdiL (CAAX protease family)
MPALVARTTLEPVLLWFLVAGFALFVPLLLFGTFLLRGERTALSGLWRERLRFCPITRSDWLWAVGSIGLVALLTMGTMALLKSLNSGFQLTPSFLQMQPLTAGRYWILGVWLPFWVVNILAEEFLWRAIVLPRQELALGRWAWLANGTGWMLFHLAFGAPIMVMLWPIALVLPYVVQRRRNTWIGIVIHAGLNGPGFLATAFGLV